MSELISPVAIGLISDPPTVVLSYDCISTLRQGERRKRRKRKMPLRDFTDRSNVKRYAFNLRQRHAKYLADVLDVTLEKMLRIIQEIQKGNSVERSLDIVNKDYSIDPEEDLNKLSPAQLAQRKAVMDEMFRQHLIKPEDPNFVYDREVNFELKNEKGNDWDDDSEKVQSNNDDLDSNINDRRTPTFLKDDEGSFPVITVNNSESKELEIKISEEALDKHENIEVAANTPNADKYSTVTSINQIGAQFSEVQIQQSPSLDNGTNEKAKEQVDDESSSNHDIEEALVNIESGVLEEEDEDFWA